MAQNLVNVTIDRVDLVDRPANPGARIAMFKRDFSQDERDKAADTGAAMPDGSFPIKNAGDLKNAIRLAGNARDPAAAKRHIIARAKSLGVTDQLPDGWGVSKSAEDDIFKSLIGQYPELTSQPINLDGAGHVHAVDGGDPEPAQTFEEVVADDEAEDFANKLTCDINDAVCCLQESVCSILEDDDVTDKPKMLADTFKQFHQHLQTLTGEDLKKALGQAMAVHEGEDPMAQMTEEAIRKAISDEVVKTTKAKDDEIAALKADIVKRDDELIIAKMKPEHVDFAKASEMSDEQKKKFAAMTDEEKAKYMKDHPVEKALPESVRKQLAEFEEIKKQQAEYATEREVVAFGKRAVGIGLVEAEGEILRKAYKGDAESIKKLEEKIKGLNEQVKKGGLFKEFGTQRGGDVTGGAMAQIIAKRDELKQTDPKLTNEQAFAKVYADPANRELVALEKRERLAGSQQAAA